MFWIHGRMLSEYAHKSRWLTVGMLLSSPLVAADKSAGQTAYEMNCMACHLVDARGVGPSLVKVAETYPVEELEAFLAWVKDPGKKDPNMIQMPPMGHLSAEVVTGIHGYLLTATEGKVEKKGRHQFPGFKEPQRELPYVVRGFLPDSSPASVMVKLSEKLNVGWDTDTCRFLYAWNGEKSIKAGSRSALELSSAPFYAETADNLWSFGAGLNPDYGGYRLIEGFPEFYYKIGAVEIREKITAGDLPGSVQRDFELSGVSGAVRLTLDGTGDAQISSDEGHMEGRLLTLTADQAKSFTLKIYQP